jgi:uncharacterized protein (DUF1499 family)
LSRAASLAVASIIALGACADPSDRSEAMNTANAAHLTNFATLVRSSSPNSRLIAPVAAAAAVQADAVAPVLEVPAARLAEAWSTIVRAQPRTRVIAVSEDGLQVEAEQRTALFGFVDRISFRAVSVDAGRATFFVYSRSQTGSWDLGVNRRRLRRWLAALEEMTVARTQP